MSNSYFKLPGWLKYSCNSVEVFLLAVSCVHAAWFMWDTTPPGLLRLAMISLIIGLFLGSHLLAHLFGFAFKLRHYLLCFLLITPSILVLQTISVHTTSAATTNRVAVVERLENHSSPEYKRHQQSIANYQTQIDALNDTIKALDPVRGRTDRGKAIAQVAQLQAKIEHTQALADAVNVSTTADTYKTLESSTRMGIGQISTLISIMVSAVPIIIAIVITVLNGNKSIKRSASGKKPAGSTLRAVA